MKRAGKEKVLAAGAIIAVLAVVFTDPWWADNWLVIGIVSAMLVLSWVVGFAMGRDCDD